MSRDFVGALLQLNAEKQVSREQLIGAVEDGIQSAYRRVAGDEDIHVRIDAESGRIRVFRARLVVEVRISGEPWQEAVGLPFAREGTYLGFVALDDTPRTLDEARVTVADVPSWELLDLALVVYG